MRYLPTPARLLSVSTFLAGADASTDESQTLFVVNNSYAGLEKTLVFGILCKQRSELAEDYIEVFGDKASPGESDKDFESGIDNVKASLRKLHMQFATNTGTVAL